MTWLVVVTAMACAFGGFGAWVAGEKRRSPVEGFVISFLFGPLGVLVVALLPAGGSGAGRKRAYDSRLMDDREPRPEWLSGPERQDDIIDRIRRGKPL